MAIGAFQIFSFGVAAGKGTPGGFAALRPAMNGPSVGQLLLHLVNAESLVGHPVKIT
jgi:hypothetical protein